MATVMELLERGLVTLNAGMSNGGEYRVTIWTIEGPKHIGTFPIVFLTQGGETFYDPERLKKFWVDKRPQLDGMSLWGLVNGGTAAVGFSSWGADLVALDVNDEPLIAVNYPSAFERKEIVDYVRGLPDMWWHDQLCGAAQDAYQPLGQLQVLKLKLADTWGHVKAIVPVADYLFYMLTGCMGHDATMLQSQGMLGEAAKVAVQQRFGEPLCPGILCPWKELSPDAVIGVEGVGFCVPGTHDSPLARAIGFSVADTVVWTGSWGGVAANIDGTDIVPCDATCEAGLSFEGLTPRALQKNTGMFGPVYKLLCQRAGMSYAEAAEFVLGRSDLPRLSSDTVDDLCSGSPEEVAERIMSELEETSCSEALAVVLHTAVECVWEDLQKLAQVTCMSLNRVAVVGGWAENRAFCTLLQEHGVEVVKPQHAAKATDIGLAVDMLRRLAEEDGQPVPVEKIIEQISV